MTSTGITLRPFSAARPCRRAACRSWAWAWALSVRASVRGQAREAGTEKSGVSGISLSRAASSYSLRHGADQRVGRVRPMKLRPRDNLDQYILNSRSQARRLSIAIGRGPPRPQWSPDHELRKGRRQAAKSWGGGRSSPTSPASRLPTPSTEGARVGSRPPQGNEDGRISVHRVHKVSSGRSVRIEPSALCS